MYEDSEMDIRVFFHTKLRNKSAAGIRCHAESSVCWSENWAIYLLADIINNFIFKISMLD